MNDRSFESLENRLQAAGRTFAFPATPDVAASVGRDLRQRTLRRQPYWTVRRLAWTVILLAALGAALWAVPPVRAQVQAWLQIGAVQILLGEPTSTPLPGYLARTATEGLPVQLSPAVPTATPPDQFTYLKLRGEITLIEARRRSSFPIRLPAYPSDLGEPDHVFYQNGGAATVVLVWTAENNPDQVLLSLTAIDQDSTYIKKEPEIILTTTVRDQFAVWTEGPYYLTLQDRGSAPVKLLVEGHVLVWVEGDITYRLETDLPLEEARKIAESLDLGTP